jgi:hypothetical protein
VACLFKRVAAPFPELDDRSVMVRVLAQNLRPTVPAVLSSDFGALLERMWHQARVACVVWWVRGCACCVHPPLLPRFMRSVILACHRRLRSLDHALSTTHVRVVRMCVSHRYVRWYRRSGVDRVAASSLSALPE